MGLKEIHFSGSQLSLLFKGFLFYNGRGYLFFKTTMITTHKNLQGSWKSNLINILTGGC